MATVTNLKPALSLVTTINIDAKDQYGRTSLHRAVMKSEEAVAEGMNEQAAADSIIRIMANGASLDILDETFRTPLDYDESLITLGNMISSIRNGLVLNDKQTLEVRAKLRAYIHSNRREKEIKKLNQQSVETKAINNKKKQIHKYDHALRVYAVISMLSVFSAAFTLGVVGFGVGLIIHSVCGLSLWESRRLVK